MGRIRTLAGGLAAWVALSSQAGAAPMSWFDSQASLTAWYANQLNSAGNIYASPASANAITNLTASWYGTPAPVTVSPPAANAVVLTAPAYTPVASVAPAPTATDCKPF